MTLTYPSGFQVKNVYGAHGYLTEIKKGDGSVTYWKASDTDAEGHVTKEEYGNGIVTDRVYVPENGFLKEIVSTQGSSGPVVQNLEYRFDLIGNLKKRADNRQGLTENFLHDALNRITSAQINGQAARTFSYDTIGQAGASLGNLISKGGDVLDYAVPPGSLQPGERPHPHAVRKVNGGTAATYDKNGNMLTGFGRTMEWSWFNMPQSISGFGVTHHFAYDPDHNRVKQTVVGPGGTIETVYVGGFYERVSEGNFVYRKHYINAPTGRLAVFSEKIQALMGDPQYGMVVSSATKYLLKDHLGSIDMVTNESGGTIEQTSFDAWGARRTSGWGDLSNPKSYASVVSRGYTDHEQLDDLGLVHMNGRIYDHGIGRFLSADPFVQAPMMTQNFNRYSYVVNNPLSFTDPSGFNFFGDVFKWFNETLGSTGAQIVLGVATVAIGVATAGAFTAAAGFIIGSAYQLTAFGAAVVGGAGFGFGAGFSGTLLAGGSIGQAFQAGLIGGVIGGISGGIAHGIGSLFPSTGSDFLSEMFSFNHFGRTVGHATLGGATSEVQGGNWEDGAIAAGVSQGLAPAVGLFGTKAERVAASAVIGGTAAELGGGKFANGAATAAFMRLYNDEGGHPQGKWDRREPQSWANSFGRLKSTPILTDADIAASLELTAEYVEQSNVGAMSWGEYKEFMEYLDTIRPGPPNSSFHKGGYFYYSGGRYGKAGYYNGNAINYFGVGEGFAAAGIPRPLMNAFITYWKIKQYGVTPFQGGEFHFAEVGYDYYKGRH